MIPPASASHRAVLIRVAAALLLAGAIAVVWFSPLREKLDLDHAREAGRMLSESWFGPPLFILTFGILGVLLVPATVFVVTAALVWGWGTGGTYSLAGASLGALLSFLLARWMGGGIAARLGERGRQLTDRLRNSGFSALLILRLIPIFPYAMLNYASGLAGLRSRDFVAATVIGLAPSIFIVSYSADAIARGTLSGGDAFGRLLVAGVLLAILAIVPMALKRRAGKMISLETE